MKVLLLFPKWTGDYGIFAHFAKRASVWPPLNLAYLGAIAETRGHEVKIIDGEAENCSIEEMVYYAGVFKPDLIGITATTPFFHTATKLAKAIKDSLPNLPITIGGPHITILKEKAFSPFYDYAFVGESEESWPIFLRRYEKGSDISDIKGVLYRHKGKIKYTGDAKPIMEIDTIPLPARHLLKLNNYKIGTLQGRKRFTTIMTSRGCPFKCIFCSTKVFGRIIRKRSPRLVVDEMISVISNFNIKHFIILDDSLTLHRQHILDICDIIEGQGLDITFEGSTRANLVDEEVIMRMARAGLIRLSFGLESVDENLRRIMRKEVPLDSYNIANRLTEKYNIETLNSCMIGLPGETIKTICETLSFLRTSHEIKQANISIAVPYPGTELFEMAMNKEHGLELHNDDFSSFRRYNAAVMKVGDLTPEDLIQLQNDAFISTYIVPWRWKSMFKRSGIQGVLLTLSRLKASILSGKINFITNKPRKYFAH